MENYLEDCSVCPRNCHIDRRFRKGRCGVDGEGIYVSRAALHFYEEPCISGRNGSGTVFFSGCSLHCVYCQNRAISDGVHGKHLTKEQLARVFLDLQAKGAHNINLVTPAHYTYQIREALILARKQGLSLPVVHNGSGYEKPETLKALEGLVDIYLTDFKYMDAELARDLSGAPDYPERAKEALAEMVRQQLACEFGPDGLMKRGVIVRNLLLPGHVSNSKAVVRYLWETYGNRIYLSLMNQYTPMGTFERFPYLNRKVTRREYERLISYALELGVEQAFIQEGDTAEESFIPPFDESGLEDY